MVPVTRLTLERFMNNSRFKTIGIVNETMISYEYRISLGPAYVFHSLSHLLSFRHVFSNFFLSSHLPISILLPFSFHLFFLLCPRFHPGLAVASGFNFTSALILALVFYPSYVIVLMSPLFCSCFPSPIPLSLPFFIAFNLFFALFT